VPRRVIEGAVLVVLGFYLFGHTLPRAWRTLNTDFPNYYLAAKLTREGVDPARAYEWIWLQREKDHRAIDQRVVGLVPITPFSTLAIWPLTGMAPLAAKNAWLIFNLLLLFPIAWLMRAISGLSLLQIGCLFGMCFPLQRNLLYGQYYIVLLGILTAACWAAQRQRNSLAGSLVALGVAVKIFPVILTLHFIRKKNWAAVFAGVLTGILCVLVSVWVFGWSLHRTYLLQVLPWTVRGEVLDPYNLGSSSLSTLLHRLFIFEPQWNAHPALHAPWLLAILHPALQLGTAAGDAHFHAVACFLPLHGADSPRGRSLWTAHAGAALDFGGGCFGAFPCGGISGMEHCAGGWMGGSAACKASVCACAADCGGALSDEAWQG
jgi:hypothetical protein